MHGALHVKSGSQPVINKGAGLEVHVGLTSSVLKGEMSGLSPSAELPSVSQDLAELPDASDFSLGRDDNSSSLGSDSELNGMAPYRQIDRYGFIGGSDLNNSFATEVGRLTDIDVGLRDSDFLSQSVAVMTGILDGHYLT
ncbi:UNVERIFIED_CONTAM: hypothetical protein K2H54_008052 [Gekko kuhli]